MRCECSCWCWFFSCEREPAEDGGAGAAAGIVEEGLGEQRIGAEVADACFSWLCGCKDKI